MKVVVLDRKKELLTGIENRVCIEGMMNYKKMLMGLFKYEISV